MGEAFLRQHTPHPIITRGSTELPSPARGECAIMPTEFAVASHYVKQPTSRCRDAFRIPLAHPRYVVNRRSQDVVTSSAESWANAGQGREIRPFQKAHLCDLRHIQAARAIAIFSAWREGSHRWRLLWPILSVSDLSSARIPRCCWAFSGAGLRFASSARCPMTSPIGSGAGDTFDRRNGTTPAREPPLQRLAQDARAHA